MKWVIKTASGTQYKVDTEKHEFERISERPLVDATFGMPVEGTKSIAKMYTNDVLPTLGQCMLFELDESGDEWIRSTPVVSMHPAD